MHNTNRLSKPLKGGCFGTGKYELQTEPIICDGMHAVRYIVAEVHSGSVLAIAASRRLALDGARALLSSPTDSGPRAIQLELWPASALSVISGPETPGPSETNLKSASL